MPLLPALRSAVTSAARRAAPLAPVDAATLSRAARPADGFAPSSYRPDVGWMLRDSNKPAVNRNGAFWEGYKAAAAGRPNLPAEAKDYVYLTVPGLFSDRVPGYMNDNDRALRNAGLDVKRVNVDADAAIETNAKTIRDAVLLASKSGKKVVLMGHSKGGVDAAAALAIYPELKGHVRALITMQSPFGGSPVANDLMANRGLAHMTSGIVNLFRGDPSSVRDLTHESQKRLFTAHPYPTEIPTVCLASYTNNPLSPLGAPAAYIRGRYGEPNDGLVCAKDAILPGSTSVLIEGLDHACAVLTGVRGFSAVDPAEASLALVGLALSKR